MTTATRLAIFLAFACVVGGSTAMAQDKPIRRIPAPGGEVAITSAADEAAYDTYKYAPVRRAGDYVYVSGVVIGRLADGPRTVETFKAAARAGFEKLRARLRAVGADFDQVVMVNSFHDWTAPEFGGDRLAQFNAFNEVKEEFMTGVHPAWTAVGTSGLIRDSGIVEVQMIAYAPPRTKSRRPRRPDLP